MKRSSKYGVDRESAVQKRYTRKTTFIIISVIILFGILLTSGIVFLRYGGDINAFLGVPENRDSSSETADVSESAIPSLSVADEAVCPVRIVFFCRDGAALKFGVTAGFYPAENKIRVRYVDPGRKLELPSGKKTVAAALESESLSDIASAICSGEACEVKYAEITPQNLAKFIGYLTPAAEISFSASYEFVSGAKSYSFYPGTATPDAAALGDLLIFAGSSADADTLVPSVCADILRSAFAQSPRNENLFTSLVNLVKTDVTAAYYSEKADIINAMISSGAEITAVG